MKKTFSLLLLLCFLSTIVIAQSNLKFSKVLDMSPGQTYTVPSGKVVKVESVSYAGGGSFYLTFDSCIQFTYSATCFYSSHVPEFTIGSLSQSYTNAYSTSISGSNVCGTCPPTTRVNPSFNLTFPIWLGAGEVITLGAGTGFQLSALEFFVTQ